MSANAYETLKLCKYSIKMRRCVGKRRQLKTNFTMLCRELYRLNRSEVFEAEAKIFLYTHQQMTFRKFFF